MKKTQLGEKCSFPPLDRLNNTAEQRQLFPRLGKGRWIVAVDLPLSDLVASVLSPFSDVIKEDAHFCVHA